MDKIPETQALFLEDFKWRDTGARRFGRFSTGRFALRSVHRKSAVAATDFPITRRIEEYKVAHRSPEPWVDRDDKLTPEALSGFTGWGIDLSHTALFGLSDRI